ncbi:MAG TPA: hypothetical protein VK281_08855 [Xanthobacteraceae bacterium]|nr:hypothetical protein [Xanthobacteraceae bacterium]
MSRRDRAILTAAVLLCGVALAGCETADMADKVGEFSDKFSDMIPGTAKKPLPGDRKPVFPEGVPGVAQGLPSDLIKGNQPPPEAAPPPPPKQAALESDKPKPKKKAQEKPKPPEQAANPADSATPARPVQGAAWPAPPTQQPAQWPAPTQQAPAAWPAPPSGQAALPAPAPVPSSQQLH